MDASNCDVAFTNWSHWHEIPRQDAHQVVGRLQARIANAAKADDWRKARRPQKLLTRSISAKALTVKRVTENQGHKTPGIDRQTWSTPDEKWQAVQPLQPLQPLQHQGYHPRGFDSHHPHHSHPDRLGEATPSSHSLRPGAFCGVC